MRLMKKLLLLVAALGLVSGASLLAVNHHKNYINKKTHEAQISQQRTTDKIVKLSVQVEALQQESNDLRIECGKGLSAYNLLPAVTKAKTPQPSCVVTPR